MWPTPRPSMLLRAIADQEALVISATMLWIVWQLVQLRPGWPLLCEVVCSISKVLLLGPILTSHEKCKDPKNNLASRKRDPRLNSRQQPSHDLRAAADLRLPRTPSNQHREQLSVIAGVSGSPTMQPQIADCVSISKPMAGNTWAPWVPSAVAGACSNSGSSSGNGQPTGQGSTTVAAQTGASTSDARSSSMNALAGQAGSTSRGGGWDDSDDGDGRKPPRQQKLATSHSLDMTAPMAEKIASAIETATRAADNASSSRDDSNALAGEVQQGSSVSVSLAVESGQNQQTTPDSTGSTTIMQNSYPAAAGNTGPWRLHSPFTAVGSPFGSNSSSSSNASSSSQQHSKDAVASVAGAECVQPAPQAACETATVSAVAPNLPPAAAAAAAPAVPAGKGTMVPWRLPSHFAAGPPFGSKRGSGKGGGSSSSGSSSNSGKSNSAHKAAAAAADGPKPADTPAKGTTGPWQLLSPFAAAGFPFGSASGRGSRSQRNSTSQEATLPDAKVAAAAAAAAEASCTPAVATTGPWKLSSPIAGAGSPFGGGESSSERTAEQGLARKSLKHKEIAAAAPQVKDSSSSSRAASAGESAAPNSSSIAGQASASPAAAAAAVMGPWKLTSPFAAPLPAFSIAEEKEAPTAAGKDADHAVSAANKRHAKPRKEKIPAGAAHSSTAAAAAAAGALLPKQPRHPRKSHSQSTLSLPKQHGSTSAGKAGARRSLEQAAGFNPKGATGPWALHSPFAAAASPAASAQESASSRKAAADPFGSPIVDNASPGGKVHSAANAEAAGSAAATAAASVTPTGVMISSMAVHSADASFDAWTASSRAATPRAGTAAQTAVEGSHAASSSPEASRTGPWHLYSPFAAAAAAAAPPAAVSDGAVDSPGAAAAAAGVQSERSDSAGSSSSSSTPQHRLLSKRAAAAAIPAAGSSSSRASGMGGTNSSSNDSLAGSSKPPSIAAASQPQYSIPFSFPTTAGSGSNAAPTMSSAATAALHDLLELDVQLTPHSSHMESASLPDGGLSPVPSCGAEMMLPPLQEEEEEEEALQQQQRRQQQCSTANAAACAPIDVKANVAAQLQTRQQQQDEQQQQQQQQVGSPPGLDVCSVEPQKQHRHLPSIDIARARHLHDSVTSHLKTHQKHPGPSTTALTLQQGIAASLAPGAAPATVQPGPVTPSSVTTQQAAAAVGALPTTAAALAAVQAAALASQTTPRSATAVAFSPAAAAAVTTTPAAVAAPVQQVAASSPSSVGAAPTAASCAAPVSPFAAPVVVPAVVPHPLTPAAPAAAAAAMPPPAATAASVTGAATPAQAGSRSIQSSGTVTPTVSPRAAAVPAAGAVLAAPLARSSSPSAGLQVPAAEAAAASKSISMSCLCCYPPCLTEGVPAEAHVYVLLGAEQQPGARQQASSGHASGSGMDTYHAVALFGSVVVADVRSVLRPQEGLFRVALPALPKGAVRMAVALNDQPISFVQTLLVLPAPCAQEMVLLWASLLQTRLTAAAQLQQQQEQRAAATQPGTSSFAQQQQQQQQPGEASPSPRGSFEVSAISEDTGSVWTSQGSAASHSDSGSNALPGGPGGSTPSATEHRTAHSTAAFNYQAAVAGTRHGQSSAAVSPADVQAVWHEQYLPVLTDIAFLLSQHSPKAAASGPGVASGQSSPTAAAAAAAGLAAGSPRTSFIGSSGAFAPAVHASIQVDSPEFKSLVTQLVQFLAANGMWAVLQLITDSVYGVGASAKALYTAKSVLGPAGAPTTASATPSGTPIGSHAGGSGRGSIGSVGSGQVRSAPGAPRQHASPHTSSGSIVTDSSVASSERSSRAAEQQRQLAAGEAVAAAVAAVQAGQAPELGGVFVLLTLVLKIYLVRQCANLLSVLRQAAGLLTLSDVLRDVGRVLGNGVMLFAVGVVWLGELLSEKVLQPLFKSEPDS